MIYFLITSLLISTLDAEKGIDTEKSGDGVESRILTITVKNVINSNVLKGKFDINNHSVDLIKRKVARKWDIPADEQRIIFNGQILTDEILDDICDKMDKKKDDRKEINVIMIKKKYIMIVDLTGNEFEFPYDPTLTVKELRVSMGRHLGILPENLTLSFVGKLLNDADGKLPSNLREGATVKLGLKQTTGFKMENGKMYS